MTLEYSELVLRASKGDNQAVTQLYNDTYRQAYQVAVQMVHDEQETFDILQDSYIKAFNNLANLKEPSKFKSWFFQIVSNMCKDYLRKRKNNPVFFSDMTYENDEGDAEIEFVDESITFSPESNVDYSETKRLISEMLDNLPEDQKLVLLMYYLQNLSIKEIAQALEISENTVKSRMNYGKKKLKIQVEELEKKGTKLYSIAGFTLFGFIVWMFNQSAQSISVPDISKVVSINTNTAPITDSTATQSVENTTTNSQQNPQTTQNTHQSTTNSAAQNVAKATATVAKKASKHILPKVLGGVMAVTVASTTAAAVISPSFRRNIDIFGLFTGPETTVEIFEDAFNSNDVNKMIECLPPETQEIFKIQLEAANGIGGLFGLNNLATPESIGGLLGIVTNGQDVKMEVKNIEYNDSKDYATVTVNISYGTYLDNKQTDINMEKESNKWYFDVKY